jgi:hypothetical protein
VTHQATPVTPTSFTHAARLEPAACSLCVCQPQHPAWARLGGRHSIDMCCWRSLAKGRQAIVFPPSVRPTSISVAREELAAGQFRSITTTLTRSNTTSVHRHIPHCGCRVLSRGCGLGSESGSPKPGPEDLALRPSQPLGYQMLTVCARGSCQTMVNRSSLVAERPTPWDLQIGPGRSKPYGSPVWLQRVYRCICMGSKCCSPLPCVILPQTE